MKRYGILALTLVLCCALFTGCRRGNMTPSSPTNEATTAMPTMPTLMPDTHPATEPATRPTEPEATEPSTGGMGAATEDATDPSQPGRSRANPKNPATR